MQFKQGDLVTLMRLLQVTSGYPDGSQSFFGGQPGLVIDSNDAGVVVLCCNEVHRNISHESVVLFSAAENN